MPVGIQWCHLTSYIKAVTKSRSVYNISIKLFKIKPPPHTHTHTHTYLVSHCAYIKGIHTMHQISKTLWEAKLPPFTFKFDAGEGENSWGKGGWLNWLKSSWLSESLTCKGFQSVWRAIISKVWMSAGGTPMLWMVMTWRHCAEHFMMPHRWKTNLPVLWPRPSRGVALLVSCLGNIAPQNTLAVWICICPVYVWQVSAVVLFSGSQSYSYNYVIYVLILSWVMLNWWQWLFRQLACEEFVYMTGVCGWLANVLYCKSIGHGLTRQGEGCFSVFPSQHLRKLSVPSLPSYA